jgi:hypothetical protein
MKKRRKKKHSRRRENNACLFKDGDPANANQSIFGTRVFAHKTTKRRKTRGVKNQRAIREGLPHT